MPKPSLKLLAGRHALSIIRNEGLQPNQIRLMIGASGGPKWLMLSRLDQYLGAHFLAQASQPIDLLGSSIGAWRMACHATNDPLATFRTFESHYLQQHYPHPIRPHHIRGFVDEILNTLFPTQQCLNVVNNPKRPLHIVAVRNRQLLNSRSKSVQALSLSLAALGNALSPGLVRALYPPVLIHPANRTRPIHAQAEFITLLSDNLHQALVASGAIPMAMEPTRISGGKARWYWDGGICDYHFGGPFNLDDGLILYPHFSTRVIPGWFDKALSWRQPKAEHYERVVMIAPDPEFIRQLPYRKIPDRHDFKTLNDTDRETYWQAVLAQTDRLVDDLHNALEKDGGRSLVEPLVFG